MNILLRVHTTSIDCRISSKLKSDFTNSIIAKILIETYLNSILAMKYEYILWNEQLETEWGINNATWNGIVYSYMLQQLDVQRPVNYSHNSHSKIK